MNTKKVILFNLISWALLFSFIVWKNQSSTKKSETITSQIFERKYKCVVKEKIKEVNNHGFLTLVLFDIDRNENFNFDPIYISSGLTIFRLANIGDTINKMPRSNVFYIMNGEKRDSVIFEFNIN